MQNSSLTSGVFKFIYYSTTIGTSYIENVLRQMINIKGCTFKTSECFIKRQLNLHEFEVYNILKAKNNILSPIILPLFAIVEYEGWYYYIYPIVYQGKEIDLPFDEDIDENKILNHIFTLVKELVKLWQQSSFIHRDIKWSNIGWYNDRLVLLDLKDCICRNDDGSWNVYFIKHVFNIAQSLFEIDENLMDWRKTVKIYIDHLIISFVDKQSLKMEFNILERMYRQSLQLDVLHMNNITKYSSILDIFGILSLLPRVFKYGKNSRKIYNTIIKLKYPLQTWINITNIFQQYICENFS